MEGRLPCRPVRASGTREFPCSRDWVKRCEIVVRADVGGVLVAPRLLTSKELRGERATYTPSRKRSRRVFTQSLTQRATT